MSKNKKNDGLYSNRYESDIKAIKKKTIMRISPQLKNKLAGMRLQKKKKNNHNIESYADVVKRLLKEHWTDMIKEKEDTGR